MSCLSGGIFDMKKLVSHVFPLEKAQDALYVSADASNGSIKVVVVDEEKACELVSDRMQFTELGAMNGCTGEAFYRRWIQFWDEGSTGIMPKAAKRSACDQCRAKRVRCLRPEGSTEPCARCATSRASCVTGAPGYPGRPRKGTPRDKDELALCNNTPAVDGAMLINTPASWVGPETALNLLEDFGAAVHQHQPKGVLFQEHSYPDPDPPSESGRAADLFNFPMSVEGLATLQQPATTLQELPRPDGLDIYSGQDFDDMLDVGFLSPSGCQLMSPVPAQRPSTATSLIQLREKIERHVSVMGGFLSDPRNIVENCPEGTMGMMSENPLAMAIMCAEEFVDIIQNLAQSAITTETTLLVLSSYLQLIRLYDSLFHAVYQCLSQIPPETIKSIKVKAVFRVVGISSLQDVPGKVYAKGVVDVIQSHIQTVERCIGLPAVYCLSGEGDASPKGIFADVDRERLLHIAMAQEDVRSPRGNKSYVDSIRENIRNTVALF
ncbi:uncharacterized protein APUU_31692A [Aspergillus puulaauensis]|uniref:Zn(2)-C6 fungal-type domain-containing protein n=1 Tax=Aspergillus puulaauensis TaxID=1220207 RepID=A0A7R8AN59_9EURO|nr:uncharacterized protein APUU_31692A [Aspergillus puulaauensis]BCS23468.1 hypothetical protein APUU_31692A [Aspergillus puulaauensis]